MDVRVIDDNSWWVPGHDLSPHDIADAIAVVAPSVPIGRFMEAWWSEPAESFCNAPNDDNAHQEPQPVTVVHRMQI
jgi:hypothetical protein